MKKKNISASSFNIMIIIILLIFFIFTFVVISKAVSLNKAVKNKDNISREVYLRERDFNIDLELEEKIVSDIKKNRKIDLSKLNFDFNKLCIYYSYSMLERFSQIVTVSNSRVVRTYDEEIPRKGFSFIVFVDKDYRPVRSITLNKKYDISENRSYKEILRKDAIFEFEKVGDETNEKYKLKK
ncbi:TPA: hypothetical protein KQG29_001430 [Clostridioides difficile]|nr:hypothetical protein [Clostridioides difficile]